MLVHMKCKNEVSMSATDDETVNTSSLPEGICLISINRPNRRSAVNPATAKKLYEAFLAFEANDEQKVCVFYGEHGTFCAGADLHEVAQMKPEDKETQIAGQVHREVREHSQGPMGPSRMQVKKPVIAAVSGHAVAGGLELSLIADIRVVEESAIFGVYCRRWGVPLIDGGTVRLQKIVGLGRAMDMILTGRPVSAQEALSFGLANRVVANGTALDEAISLAKQLVKFPQLCMNVDRNSAYYTAYNATSFEDAMRNEFEQGFKVVAAEGVAGARKFSSGSGRHGGFSDTSKPSKL